MLDGKLKNIMYEVITSHQTQTCIKFADVLT